MHELANTNELIESVTATSISNESTEVLGRK